MAKIGKNKKRCEKYRNSGHKEINKTLRQERHKKRQAYFMKRRSDGKPNASRTSHQPVGDGAKTNKTEKDSITYVRRPSQLPLSWWTGIMRRTKNYLDKGSQISRQQAAEYTRKKSGKIQPVDEYNEE